MRKPVPALVMSGGKRAALEVLSKSRTASHREVQRAQGLLLAGDGLANEWIARPAGMAPETVGLLACPVRWEMLGEAGQGACWAVPEALDSAVED